MLTTLSSAAALFSLSLLLTSTSLPSTLAAYTLQPTAECPILGPIWPPSTYPITTSAAFTAAKDAFPSTIQSLFDAGVIDPATSTFALDVYSTRTKEIIYQYFHVATEEGANATLSAGALDDGTVFRVGSVSKVHTVYAILLAGGKGLDIFNEKVTKYVPELLREDEGEDGDFDPLTQIKWEEITIGALANQDGGVGGPSTAVASCGCNTTSCDLSRAPQCTQDFLAYLRDTRHPAHPIYQTPTYADAGFIMLTQVLVSMTNLTYDEAVREYISEPLGMTTTSTVAREAQEANAVILPGGILEGSNWGVDNQALAGSGGIYSSLHDLRLLGLSILSHTLLSPLTTNQWLKPTGHLASPYKAVGAPWEIERLALPISPNSSRTRISDQYTKGGGQLGYTAIFALSPDHGVGYSVLVAGPGSGGDRWPLRAALGEAFVTAAEWAGWEHAKANWEGTYVDEREGEEGTNLTLSVRPDHPGVGLEKMFIGGMDWRANLTQQYAEPLPAAVLANMSTPMYHTGLSTSGECKTGHTSGDDGCQLQRLQFRATPNLLPHTFPTTRVAAEGGTGLFDDVCSQPYATTAFYYDGGSAIDEFVFVVDEEGRVERVEYPAKGAKFVKVG